LTENQSLLACLKAIKAHSNYSRGKGWDQIIRAEIIRVYQLAGKAFVQREKGAVKRWKEKGISTSKLYEENLKAGKFWNKLEKEEEKKSKRQY